MLVSATLLPGVVVAGPFEDATATRDSGDAATAFRLFQQIADQGDALAQIKIGAMYAEGQGVGQDYTEAAEMVSPSRRTKQPKSTIQFRDHVSARPGRNPKLPSKPQSGIICLPSQGYPFAQYNIGVLHAEGNGAASRDDEAAKSYRHDRARTPRRPIQSRSFLCEGAGCAWSNAGGSPWARMAADQAT